MTTYEAVRSATDEARAVAPLGVLADSWPATHVVVLSFTANLGFFSRTAAWRARSRGARVTIVSDVNQTAFDPGGVRGAGRDWLDGRAWCRGAFHPKVVVVAGPEGTTVLVGSGNATPAGWIDNAEVWIRVDASTEGGPRFIPAVGRWLGGLADGDSVSFSPGVAPALRLAAEHLTGLPAQESGPELVHNLDRPILEGLPTGPVETLRVTSPFLDPGCVALRAVCGRLRPKALTVAVADNFKLDGAVLRAVLEEFNGQALHLDSSRYHHGKVLEWTIDGSSHALLGSPNCTVAGLLKSVAEADANCELAALCRIDSTLFPEEARTPTSAERIAAHRWTPSGTGHQSLLVAAIMEADGLRLTLRRPAPTDLIVQWFADGVWVSSSFVVPVGAQEHLCRGWPTGSAVPVRTLTRGGDESTPVAVTALDQLAPRRPAHHDPGGGTRDVIENPQFLAELQAALHLIRQRIQDVPTAPLPLAGPSVRSGHGDPKPTPKPTPVAEWIAQLSEEAGHRFLWFILPRLARRTALVGQVETGHDKGEEAEEADNGPLTITKGELERLERRIGDLRRWCETALEPQTGFVDHGTCTELEIAIAAVVLAAHQFRAWDDPDDELVIIGKTLGLLSQPLAGPELAEDAAGVAAVGLWVAGQLVALSADSRLALHRFHHHEARLAELLANLTEAGLAERCLLLGTDAFEPAPPQEQVYKMAMEAASPDPPAHLADQLIGEGVPAERVGQVVRVYSKQAANGAAFLLRWLVQLETPGPIALTAPTAQAGQVTAAWAAPYLVLTFQQPRRRCELYAAAKGEGLGSIINVDSDLPLNEYLLARHYDGLAAPEARAVLDDCGL